jgi:hypothetical protein
MTDSHRGARGGFPSPMIVGVLTARAARPGDFQQVGPFRLCIEHAIRFVLMQFLADPLCGNVKYCATLRSRIRDVTANALECCKFRSMAHPTRFERVTFAFGVF